MPSIWRYEVYRIAPTLQLVNTVNLPTVTVMEVSPNIGQHGREDMVWNKAPTMNTYGMGQQSRRAQFEGPCFVRLNPRVDGPGKGLRYASAIAKII